MERVDVEEESTVICGGRVVELWGESIEDFVLPAAIDFGNNILFWDIFHSSDVVGGGVIPIHNPLDFVLGFANPAFFNIM